MPSRSIPVLILGLALALLAGCAGLGRDRSLVVGSSTAESIYASHGQPVRRWTNPDGGQTLEYSSQPFGRTCYMVTLDREGKFVGIEDTLREASRFAITAGMTQEQVSRRLGRERSRVFFKFSGEDVWDWNVDPEQSGHLLRFNVHFKDGVVLRTTQSMIFPGRFPFDR